MKLYAGAQLQTGGGDRASASARAASWQHKQAVWLPVPGDMQPAGVKQLLVAAVNCVQRLPNLNMRQDVQVRTRGLGGWDFRVQAMT